MNLKDQVVSLELAKKLKELGAKQDGLYFWQYIGITDRYQLQNNVAGIIDDYEQSCIAFTVAELGEMLIKQHLLIDTISTSPGGEPHKWCVTLSNKIEHIESGTKKHQAGISEIYHHKHVVMEDTEADARAKMLIYLIENKLLDPTWVKPTHGEWSHK